MPFRISNAFTETKLFRPSDKEIQNWKREVYKFLIAVNVLNIALVLLWLGTFWLEPVRDIPVLNKILVCSIVLGLSLGGSVVFLYLFEKQNLNELYVLATREAIELKGGKTEQKIFYKDITEVMISINRSGMFTSLAIKTPKETIRIAWFFNELNLMLDYIKSCLDDRTIVKSKKDSRLFKI